MKTNIKKLPKSEVEIEFELNPEEWEEFLDSAAGELSKDLKIDGFRPGKAPRNLVETKVGSENLLEKAAELAVKKTYVDEVINQNLEVIGQPEIQVLKVGLGSPFIFKAKAVCLPEVKLTDDYKKIAQNVQHKPGSELEPAEKDIDNTLEYIRKSRAMSNSKPVSTEGLPSNLEGKPSESEPELPALNDEFAKSLGNFENLEALKKSVREGLKMENEGKEKQRRRLEIIQKIAEQSKMEIPEILISSELNRMIAEFKENIVGLGLDFNKYLEEIKKTEDDFKKEWRDKAGERVKTALSLRAIAEKEKIEVGQQEIDDEINKFLRRYPNVDEAKKQIDMNALMEYTKGALKNEKVFQLLESQ